jgi:hypothetical protein
MGGPASAQPAADQGPWTRRACPSHTTHCPCSNWFGTGQAPCTLGVTPVTPCRHPTPAPHSTLGVWEGGRPTQQHPCCCRCCCCCQGDGPSRYLNHPRAASLPCHSGRVQTARNRSSHTLLLLACCKGRTMGCQRSACQGQQCCTYCSWPGGKTHPSPWAPSNWRRGRLPTQADTHNHMSGPMLLLPRLLQPPRVLPAGCC